MSEYAAVLQEAGAPAWSGRLGKLPAQGEPLTKAIAKKVDIELTRMQETLGRHADSSMFLAVRTCAHSALDRIGELSALGLIQPTGAAWPLIRGARPLRLGVFPIAANPLHWAHLLSGLAAMERFCLDKIMFVIAGSDPRKPDLASAILRHQVAQQVLRLFHPLFEYSPIALGSSLLGEVNIFRIMSSHGARPLHAFYLAGSDHCHRFAPQSGHPDTIQRLEEGVRKAIHGFDPRARWLSVVFLDRGDCSESAASFLDIHWIPQIPLKTSSTKIRGALCGQEPMCELVALPFTAYCMLCTHGTYQMQQEKVGGLAAQLNNAQEES